MTLTEFLLARIAEDEAEGLRVVSGEDWGFDVTADRRFEAYGDRVETGVGRVLAECEAKRRIVEAFSNDGVWRGHRAAERSQEVTVLTALASVYSDHPDYDEAWRA